MSFEIINDRRSERFRNVVSKTLVEILGRKLEYGPWAVMLRSDREVLRVLLTGPDARQEWAFELSNALGHAELAGDLRRRLGIGSGG